VRNRHGRAAAPLVAALALAALALLPAWSVSGVRAAGAADAQSSELVRLINGERAYLGKPALRLDRYLASKARDGAIACPNDASLIMAGRAKDIAVFGGMSHSLRLCAQYSVMDTMKIWGYRGQRGEILAMNRGYGTGKVTYTYGCSPSVTACPGAATSTYDTAAHAMAGWMRSSGHYAVIVGGYDRVGCGAWIAADGGYYYACLFSLGGGPVATPRPASGGGGGGGGSGAAPATTAPSPSPTQPPPWPSPSGAWCEFGRSGAASPTTGAAGGAPPDESPGSPDATPGAAMPVAAQVALAAGGVAGAAAFALPLLGVRRRRRTRADAAAADRRRPLG
jgi:hypothetical protein